MSYIKEVGHIYKGEGIAGFLKAYHIMLCRDAIGFSWYFFSYELLKKYMQEQKIFPELSHMIAGGLAGVTTSVLTYPIDFIKTRI